MHFVYIFTNCLFIFAASEKTTHNLVVTSQKSASSHCNAATTAPQESLPAAQGKNDANTKNKIKFPSPFINSNAAAEKEIYSNTTKKESFEKDAVTESSVMTNVKSVKSDSFQNLNFEQSINTAHEQTVNNEYFESSNMEIMEDFTSNQEFFVTNTQETKAMEELFDKLVSEENITTKTENNVKKSRSFDSIEKWLMASSNENNKNSYNPVMPVAPIGVPTVHDHDKSSVKLNMNNNKLKEKRFRNKSIDYSSLPNNDHWYNVTTTCTTKSYNPMPDDANNTSNNTRRDEEKNIITKRDSEKINVEHLVSSSADHTENSSETETEIGINNSGTMSNKNKPGLCLIIDKLKSIETKLDELKTYDTINVGFGGGTNHSSNYDPESPLLILPEVGETPTLHPGSLESSEASSSQPALAEQTTRKSSLTHQNIQGKD